MAFNPTKNIFEKGNIINYNQYAMFKKPEKINKILKPINLVEIKKISNIQNS